MPETHKPNEQEVIVIEDESLQQGFTQIPNAILRRPDVTSGAKITYMALLSYAWQKDSCFPGQETLALDTGVGKRSVIRYLQELQAVGLLEIKRRGLGLTNVYVIKRISVTARSAKLAHQEMPKTTHQEVPIWHAKEYEEEKETDELISNIRMRTRAELNVDNSVSNVDKPPRTTSFPLVSGEGETQHKPSTSSVSRNDTAASAPARRTSGEIESVGTVLKRGRGRPPKQPYDEDRQQILAYIEDFAREMGDKAPLTASVSRAYNLYKASDKPIALFVDALYQARAKTKERSAHINAAPDPAHPFAPKAKMAYYFALLEDELGLREDDPHDTASNGAPYTSRTRTQNDTV